MLNYAYSYTACATAASGGPLVSDLLTRVKFLHFVTSFAILEQTMVLLADITKWGVVLFISSVITMTSVLGVVVASVLFRGQIC